MWFISIIIVKSSTEINTLSLHDALPIYYAKPGREAWFDRQLRALEKFHVTVTFCFTPEDAGIEPHYTSPPRHPEQYARSEEHTSELQSRENLVCRLLLEKKNTIRH